MAWIFTTDGNYVNFNGGGNLWRLHKDSNCISWHWDETGDLFFDVYDQEYTVKAGNIADVIIDGVPLSAASGFPAAIQAAFTGLSASSYLVYTALIYQEGTSAPVANVLENTLGGTVVWSRIGVGSYNATLAGAFTTNKTVIVPFGGTATGIYVIGIGSSLPFDYGYALSILSNNVIQLDIYETATFNNIEFSSILGTTQTIFVEIRVYP